MKKLLKASLTVMMALTLSACGGSKDVNIGIVQYAEHPALDNAKKGFLKALEDNGYGEDNVAFDDQNAQGDGSNCTTIADKFVNDNVDLIFAIATPTAQAAANKTTEIPIVLSAVTDPASAKLVKTNEKPGGNVEQPETGAGKTYGIGTPYQAAYGTTQFGGYGAEQSV